MGAALTKRAVGLAKIQASQGVDPVPSPYLNAILLRDFSFATEAQVQERDYLRNSLSRLPHALGRKKFTGSFAFELKAGRALGARPEWSPLMRASGFQETVTATVTSRRTAAYRWTASTSGTTEFYLELAAGGDPSVTSPDFVRENGEDMIKGTKGSLQPGEWDYGDNDTLGFSTIYVRLTDNADPDSKALDYVGSGAGTKVEYTLRDTGFEYSTIYMYPDGLLLKLIDCVSNWSLTFNAGAYPLMQCQFQALYATPTDVAIPSVVNYQSQVPALSESMAFTVDSYANLVVESLTINGGLSISDFPDINSANGIKTTAITARSLSGSINPEQETEATFAQFSKWDTAKQMAISGHVGSTPQRVGFTCPNVQFGNLQSGDRQGKRILTIPLLFNEDLGSSAKEFKITLD